MTKTAQEDYYSILKCSPSATYEELKDSYQRLIKQHHPDKMISQVANSEIFIKIDQAWKVLKDNSRRKEYDASFLQDNLNDQCLIYAEIDKNELIFVDSKAKYNCRCGNDILILEEYLADEECVVECSECSNCVVIK